MIYKKILSALENARLAETLIFSYVRGLLCKWREYLNGPGGQDEE